MIVISLTTFVDFVLATGMSRLTCVRKAKELYKQDYSPGFDYWRPLRNCIVDMHKESRPKETLKFLANELTDPRKSIAYERCINSYQRWMGRKIFQPLPVNTSTWERTDLRVRVNPELGLNINGQDFIIKLYFKAEEPSKHRLNTTLHLIDKSKNTDQDKAIPAILDVQRGRLIEGTNIPSQVETLLAGEVAAFEAMWEQI